MNPRAEGAFEAVSYVREFSHRFRNSPHFQVKLESELESLIDDISSGAAVDFRYRLRMM